jgi:hypothetical protein
MQSHRWRWRTLLLEHERDRCRIIGPASQGMGHDLCEFFNRRLCEQREDFRPAFRRGSRIGLAISLEQIAQDLWNPSVAEHERAFGRAMLLRQKGHVVLGIQESFTDAEPAPVLGNDISADDDP